jgi:c-di-GMP-binding flagellar brake protein YcgR
MKHTVMVERRKYPRIDVSFPVECDILHAKNYFYTVNRDLSPGGIRIISDRFLPKESSLKVNINLIYKALSITAKVAWCNKTRLSERYMAGLEFVRISKDDQEKISRFLGMVNTLAPV